MCKGSSALQFHALIPPRHVRDSETDILRLHFCLGWKKMACQVHPCRPLHDATITFLSLTYSGLQLLVGQRIYVSFSASTPVVENGLATVEHKQYCIGQSFCRTKSNHSEKKSWFLHLWIESQL